MDGAGRGMIKNIFSVTSELHTYMQNENGVWYTLKLIHVKRTTIIISEMLYQFC